MWWQGRRSVGGTKRRIGSVGPLVVVVINVQTALVYARSAFLKRLRQMNFASFKDNFFSQEHKFSQGVNFAVIYEKKL